MHTRQNNTRVAQLTLGASKHAHILEHTSPCHFSCLGHTNRNRAYQSRQVLAAASCAACVCVWYLSVRERVKALVQHPVEVPERRLATMHTQSTHTLPNSSQFSQSNTTPREHTPCHHTRLGRADVGCQPRLATHGRPAPGPHRPPVACAMRALEYSSQPPNIAVCITDTDMARW